VKIVNNRRMTIDPRFHYVQYFPLWDTVRDSITWHEGEEEWDKAGCKFPAYKAHSYDNIPFKFVVGFRPGHNNGRPQWVNWHVRLGRGNGDYTTRWSAPIGTIRNTGGTESSTFVLEMPGSLIDDRPMKEIAIIPWNKGPDRPSSRSENKLLEVPTKGMFPAPREAPLPEGVVLVNAYSDDGGGEVWIGYMRDG
jgi:hypothetical protein